MSAKYTSLLEACDKVQLTGKLGILEESSLDEAASIKMQLMLNENLTFIKNQITRTPLVENIQVALAEKWTQAILEDISLENPFVQDEGLTAGEMAAAGTLGAGALAAGARYAAPAAQAAYNARTNSGANLTGTMMAAKQAAATPFNNDVAAVRNTAASTAQAAGNVAQAAKNQAGAAAAGFSGIQGPAKPGTQTAYKVGSTVGKVKRVFTK